MVGALGDRLARRVLARGDRQRRRLVSRPTRSDAPLRREAGALMTSGGVVPGGRAGSELLRNDPEAPFGLRYDSEAVAAAFREVWAPRSMVLVEASDLVRRRRVRPARHAGADRGRAARRGETDRRARRRAPGRRRSPRRSGGREPDPGAARYWRGGGARTRGSAGLLTSASAAPGLRAARRRRADAPRARRPPRATAT